MDPRGQVSDGRAGTGSAFILQNAWKGAQDMQAKYDAEDARTRAANARTQAQQNAKNDKDLAGLSAVDISKANPRDVPRLMELYNASVDQSAKESLAGRHPGNPRNAPEYSGMLKRTMEIKGLAAMSQQQTAELAASAKIVEGGSLEKMYDVPAFTKASEEYLAKSPQERAKGVAPTPSLVIIPDRVAQVMMKDVTMETTGDSKPTGSGVRTTVDEEYTPAQIEHGAQAFMAFPGMDAKYRNEYANLNDAQRAASGATRFEDYFENIAKTMVRNTKGEKHTATQTWSRPPAPPAENLKFQQGRQDEQTAVTSILQDVHALKEGKRDLFPRAVPGHPELLASDHFLGKSLGTAQITKTDGTKQDVNNQVKGFFFNPTSRKLYMTTTATEATGKGMVEVTDDTMLNDLIQPLYVAGGGKGDAVQRVSQPFLRPGTASMNLSNLGSPVSAQDVADQQASVQANSEKLPLIHAAMKNTALNIRVGGNVKVASENQPQMDKLNNILDGSQLYYNGGWIGSPKVTFHIKTNNQNGADVREVKLKYFETDAKHERVEKEVAITREKLAELMGNPKTLRVGEKHLQGVGSTSITAIPGTAPSAGAADAASTVVTGTSSTSNLYQKNKTPGATPPSSTGNLYNQKKK